MDSNQAARAYLLDLGLDITDDWVCEVAQRDGQDVAVVVTKGTEIHFVSLGGPAMTRRNTLQFLKPIFERWNFVTTRVPIQETDHKLRHVLGFEETWRDENFTFWMLTELPFQRRTHQ